MQTFGEIEPQDVSGETGSRPDVVHTRRSKYSISFFSRLSLI